MSEAQVPYEAESPWRPTGPSPGRFSLAFDALFGVRDEHCEWLEKRSNRWAARCGQLEAEILIQRAIITSLRASLDDARAEITRLSAEKHARDVALRRVIEAAESVHAQGERG